MNPETSPSSPLRRYLFVFGISLVLLYAILLMPSCEPLHPPASALTNSAEPFTWKQDAYWLELERGFDSLRSAGCAQVSLLFTAESLKLERHLRQFAARNAQPDDTLFSLLEQSIFRLGLQAAACPGHLVSLRNLVSVVRSVVKRQSRSWEMENERARATLYRLLYGSRGALEEAILQAPEEQPMPTITEGENELSVTPWASVLGMKIHSGDILISRGGAPTSALIARGSDYQGNFSHAALVYVDETTSVPKIIEAHIERGVTISSLEDYVKDRKLRVMVLRLRSDLPIMQADPLLPHRAATYALRRAEGEHIPYDFAMDHLDSENYFCSEVASDAYRQEGVDLWISRSRISSPGLRSWLWKFGVRNFETQEPSDLEYDPQVAVIAEWRDTEALREDHYESAVTEVMLEEAEKGMKLTYDWYLLPIARAMKAYSVLLNWFGQEGMIPEGMSAEGGLYNDYYTDLHEKLTAQLAKAAEEFTNSKGYAPPYWRLLELARVELHR